MQTLKPILVLTVVLFVFQSCGDKPQAHKPCNSSYEIHPSNIRDTVNVLDCDGLKQGKWVPTKMNKLTTTTYYHNDTIINSQ